MGDESAAEFSNPLEFVAALPDGVRQNVLALQALQEDYQSLFAQFLKERTAVQKKYEEKLNPLFLRRKEIVTGEKEPTEAEISEGKKKTEGDSKVEEIEEEEKEKAEKPKEEEDKITGIPDFWVKVLQNGEHTGDIVCAHDREALSYLQDVEYVRFEEPKEGEDEPDEGFILKFHFRENPYFKNAVLEKKYFTTLDDSNGEEALVKAEGSTIEWREKDKNLTVTLAKKKHRSKTGGKSRVVHKEETRKSFFNFFSPAQIPDNEEDMDEELLEEIEEDFMIGQSIRDQIIPSAVDWYTGEAMDLANFIGGDFGGEEDEEKSDEGAPKDAQCQQQQQ